METGFKNAINQNVAASAVVQNEILSTFECTPSTGVDGLPKSAAGRSGRIDSLDSLRGLAALSVVFHHILIAVPSIWAACEVVEKGRKIAEIGIWARLVAFTPLHAFWSGTEAVMLFFVLSGFVLMRQFMGRSTSGYLPYLIKRIWRIYPACWAALLFSAILTPLSGYHSVPQLSAGFLASSSKPFHLADLSAYLFLLGGANYLDTVIWSLFHEMRASLVFPKIAQWVMDQPSTSVLLVSGGVYILMAALRQIIGDTITPTLNFACLFVCGAVIARNVSSMKAWWSKRSSVAKFVLVASSITLYSIRWNLAWSQNISANSELANGLARIGAVLILLPVVLSPTLTRLLQNRFLTWLGRISYSLYLIHLVILSALVYAFYPRLPYWSIGALTIPISLAAAALMYRFIEAPAIRIGKSLAVRAS